MKVKYIWPLCLYVMRTGCNKNCHAYMHWINAFFFVVSLLHKFSTGFRYRILTCFFHKLSKIFNFLFFINLFRDFFLLTISGTLHTRQITLIRRFVHTLSLSTNICFAFSMLHFLLHRMRLEAYFLSDKDFSTFLEKLLRLCFSSILLFSLWYFFFQSFFFT